MRNESKNSFSKKLSTLLVPALVATLVMAPTSPAQATLGYDDTTAQQLVPAEAKIESLLTMAEQATNENAKDGDREKVMAQMAEILNTVGPKESLQIVDELLIRLEIFQLKSLRRADAQRQTMTIMVAIIVISVIGMNIGVKSLRPVSIASMVAAMTLAIFKKNEVDEIEISSKKHVKALQGELLSLQEELQRQVLASELK